MANNKWQFAYIKIEDIVPAELNANKMTDGDFDKLVRNITISGGLSSVITCYKRTSDEKYVIISGHHRYRACVKAGYTKCPVLYADESQLSRDEIIALQLSHNSLHGEDNKGILKRLFDEIQSIDFKEFANINVAEIGTIDTFQSSIVPMSEHYTVSLILYKDDIDTLDKLVGDIKEDMSKSELIILANQDNNEEMLMALTKEINNRYNIKSANISFSKILTLAKYALDNDLDSNNREREE